MTKICIDIFMYLFEFIIVYFYTNSLFETKRSKITQISILFLVNTILCVVYQFNITYINALLIFFLYSIAFFVIYKISFKTGIFHSLIFLVVMFASELLTMSFHSLSLNDFNAFENDISAYIFVILMSKLIYFSIMLCLLKLFAQKESRDHNYKYYWLLFVMPFVSVLTLITFRYATYSISLTKTMSILWVGSSIGIIFANILVFVIYENSLKSTKELYDIKAIQHQNKQDEKYFKVIEQSNKEMRIFAHDIKNHLTTIRNINNTDEIHSYVDNLIPDLEKFSYMGISKNKMLDLIISKYITLCESKGIDFSVDVKTANLSYIDDVDLSSLMNNLLDNSVEAAEKTSNGFIEIKIFSKNKMYDGLIIKNSCSQKPKTENGVLKTTKLNLKSHGAGISSIKKIIKKYNAIYDWKYDDEREIFETDVAFIKTK